MTDKILASIDAGTNSFHLLIAKAGENGRFEILAREREVVRLGTGSKDMKFLTEDAISRGVATLKRFKLICETYNAEIYATGTSAIREALNKDVFINKVFNETGINLEVISGYEEARLIYLGTLKALPIFEKKILIHKLHLNLFQ